MHQILAYGGSASLSISQTKQSGTGPLLPLDRKDILRDFLLIVLGQLQELAAIFEFAVVFLRDTHHLAEDRGQWPVLHQLDL